ncbi:MAG: 4Fe-4S ferredoxin, partial [Syntrophomonadaceae bacterium]|nr:4Fe-4S ferredoxin [Syntrophomonadaceae bacterium]
MTDITNQIRDIAIRLLKEEQIDLFIAWEKGDLEYQTKPYFAKSVEDVEKIVFD